MISWFCGYGDSHSFYCGYVMGMGIEIHSPVPTAALESIRCDSLALATQRIAQRVWQQRFTVIGRLKPTALSACYVRQLDMLYPRVGLRIDPLRLLAGCRKRRLNQAPLNLRVLI